MTKPKDNVFDFKDKKVEDFKFNTQVVSVFDDMVTRSVPYYEEMQRMISELAKDFVSPNSNVYDIGCSTATTFCLLDKVITEPNVNFIGYDNSNEMIKKAKEKLKENGVERQVSFECSDLNKNSLRIENASLITFILTLQFIRKLNR